MDTDEFNNMTPEMKLQYLKDCGFDIKNLMPTIELYSLSFIVERKELSEFITEVCGVTSKDPIESRIYKLERKNVIKRMEQRSRNNKVMYLINKSVIYNLLKEELKDI